MRKIFLCLLLMLSACSSAPEKKPFEMDDRDLYTQFASYQAIDPVSIQVTYFGYNTIGMQSADIFQIDQNIEEVMQEIASLTPTYMVARTDSMVTRMILQFEDIEGNVWVMEELSDGQDHYIGVNAGSFVLEVEESMYDEITQLDPKESADEWQVLAVHTPNNYTAGNPVDNNLAELVQDEMTQNEMMQDPRLYIKNYHDYSMDWPQYRQELMSEGIIDGSIQEMPFEEASYLGDQMHYDMETQTIEMTHLDGIYIEPTVMKIAGKTTSENQVIDYYLRYDSLNYESMMERQEDIYNMMVWLIYHPQDACFIQIENQMIDGQVERIARVIQEESDFYDHEVNRQDFVSDENGRVSWQIDNKQAYMFNERSIEDDQLTVIEENEELISISDPDSSDKGYLFDKSSGLSMSDEMIIEQYFDNDPQQVIHKAESQLGMSVCQYSDYESNKDIPACFEAEWSREGLDAKENRLVYSSFHLNEEGKLVLDVYVKVYGFRDHAVSLIME